MNERATDTPAAGAGISLDDIYFVLFRRKWLILGFVAAGVAAAAVVKFAYPSTYASEAKLLIRYVVPETRANAPMDKGVDSRPQDQRVENVINSELEILTSLDLGKDVAANLETNLLAKTAAAGKPKSGDVESLQRAAAGSIANPKSLTADVPKGSTIIRIVFEHPDGEVVQPVLAKLIERYVKKHLEIHRGVGVMDEFIRAQITALTEAIRTNGIALQGLMSKYDIISVDESKKTLNEELIRIREAFLTAEAELAERQATYDQLQGAKSDASSTNLGVSAEIKDEYIDLSERWNNLRKQESTMAAKLADENPSLVAVRKQVADALRKRKEMEKKFPDLAKLPPPSSAGESRAQGLDPLTEFAHIKALEARLGVLTNQLASLSKQASIVDTVGPEIVRLQRDREQFQASRAYFQTTLDQALLEKSDNLPHVTNIGIVQGATPPISMDKKKSKVVLGALFGVIGFGLALAFGLELFLDPRIKRASEVVKKLQVPLFMNIPAVYRNGHHRPAKGKVTAEPPPVPEPGSDPLKPYHDAVRDRLTMYFQARNMTHKPKLVGVTGCGRSSGVSTLASGLAASLSELGSGNVLLVDMGVPNGAAHSFHNGQPARTLLEALKPASGPPTTEGGQLVLAKAHDADASTAPLVPSRFSALMPKLKASDYDYIVFDMPAVTSTSPTASLASMLDMTFFVIESEKSNREVVKQSISLLASAHANVAAVMNKTRNYLPSWLHQEI